MRELGVPFLRRWIMWAAVRLGALTNPAGRKQWWTEAWRVALIAALALPLLAPAAAAIVITLLVFYLVELVAWIPLQVAHRIRERRHHSAKKVNKPTLRWKRYLGHILAPAPAACSDQAMTTPPSGLGRDH